MTINELRKKLDEICDEYGHGDVAPVMQRDSNGCPTMEILAVSVGRFTGTSCHFVDMVFTTP